jgi:hypothetical protein
MTSQPIPAREQPYYDQVVSLTNEMARVISIKEAVNLHLNILSKIAAVDPDAAMMVREGLLKLIASLPDGLERTH